MARKITRDAVCAFMHFENFKRDNTEVIGNRFYLHGNCIAERIPEGLKISTCGWCTRTTFERLGEIVRAYTGGIFSAAMRNGGVLVHLPTMKEYDFRNGDVINTNGQVIINMR